MSFTKWAGPDTVTLMDAKRITASKRRLLEHLKRVGSATVAELAAHLEVTGVAVRQHLATLQESGLVRTRRQEPEGRGRPAADWSLTPLAHDLFPDRHSDLTVELIEAARATYGEAGLERLVAHRSSGQIGAYRELLSRSGESLGDKVRALARQRTAEGYMAEAVEEGSGGYLLVEHHCPICEAAETCTGLCDAELRVFRESLGDGVQVERTRYLLSGGDRCVYRIQGTD